MNEIEDIQNAPAINIIILQLYELSCTLLFPILIMRS